MSENWKLKIGNLLRRSEKYTKTDMLYLSKGGFWLTLGQVVSSASVFLLAIAFANLIDPQTYGIYKYVLSIASILAITTLGGLGTSVTQAVARGYEGSFKKALYAKIRWGILGALGSLGLAGYYLLKGNETLALSFLLISFFVPIVDSLALFDSLLSGKKQFKRSAKFNIFIKITAAAALIATLFFTNNLFIILLAYFCSYTILRLIFLKLSLRKIKLNTKQDPQTLSYGKHLSLMGVVGALAAHLDKILIFHYLGAVEVAIYTFAIAPIEQIKGMHKTFAALALPKLANRSFAEIKSMLWSRLAMLAAVGAIAAFIYIVIAPFLYQFIFPQYTNAIIFSQIFALILLIRTPQSLLGAIVSAKLISLPKKMIYKMQITPQIMLILFLFFLAPIWGIYGIIGAKIAGSLAVMAITLFYLKKVTKQS